MPSLPFQWPSKGISSRHTSPGALLLPGHPQQLRISQLWHINARSQSQLNLSPEKQILETGSFVLSYTVMHRAKLQSSEHTSRAPACSCSLGANCMVTNGCATRRCWRTQLRASIFKATSWWPQQVGITPDWWFYTASENRQFSLTSLWRGLEREGLNLIQRLLDVFYAVLVASAPEQSPCRNGLSSLVKNHGWYEIIFSMRESQRDGVSYSSTHSCKLGCDNYEVSIFEHLLETVIQIKGHHSWHKEVVLQHSPLSILGSTHGSSPIRLVPGYLQIPGWWGPGVVQGQEVPDTQGALLLLLNTAISWGRGGSTAPPLPQRLLHYKLGFVSPLWAPAAPALSRASSQTEQPLNQTASGKDTLTESLNKIYLPPIFAERIFFNVLYILTISCSFSKVCLFSAQCKWVQEETSLSS